MKRLGIKFLVLFLCVLCAGGYGDTPASTPNPTATSAAGTNPTSSANSHAEGGPNNDDDQNTNGRELPAALAGPLIDEKAGKTLQSAQAALNSLSELSSSGSSRELFLTAAPPMIKELEQLAEYYTKNGEGEKARALLETVGKLRLALTEEPKPIISEALPPVQQSREIRTGSYSPPAKSAPVSGGTAVNSSGKSVPTAVIKPIRPKPLVPPPGSKPETVTVNGKGVSVHFLGDSKDEFEKNNGTIPLYLVPLSPETQGESSASKDRGESADPSAYLAVPASEILSLETVGTENARGVNRPEALANFAQNLPGASQDLVNGLRNFSTIQSEKDKQALQNNLRDYLKKTEGDSRVSADTREILARAVLDLQAQAVQQMSWNTGVQADELLAQYARPGANRPEFLKGVPTLSQTSEQQLKQIEKHAAEAIALAGESGAEIVKQLGDALGYKVPLAAIPELLKNLNPEDREKVRAIASLGLHTRQNSDGERTVKRDDLRRVLEDLIVSPTTTTKKPDGTEVTITATEKVGNIFSALLPKVDEELKKAQGPRRQTLLAAINGDQKQLETLLQANKISREEVQQILEGTVRDLVTQEIESGAAKLDINHPLDPETRKRVLANPIAQSLGAHLGLSENQILRTIDEQTTNILNLPRLQVADEVRAKKVTAIREQMESELTSASTPEARKEIIRKYGPQLKLWGEAGPEDHERASLAREAEKTARKELEIVEARVAEPAARLAEARRAVDQRYRVTSQMLATAEEILTGRKADGSQSDWKNLSPREQLSYLDRNGWRMYFHEKFGGDGVPLPEGKQLSDNLERIVREERPKLRSEMIRLAGVLASPEGDSRFPLLSQRERTDFPVVRTKVEYDPHTGASSESKIVENNGTYEKWLEQQKQHDPDGMRYLLEHHGQQNDQKSLNETRARVEQAVAATQAAEANVVSEGKKNRSDFFSRAGFGESAARFLYDIQAATTEAAGLTQARNSPGTSLSSRQAEAIGNLVRAREGQVVAELRSIGLPESQARSTVAAFAEDAVTKTKKSDSAFLKIERQLVKEGYEIGAFDLELSKTARLGEEGKPGGVTFDSLLRNAFILSQLSGSDIYSNNLRSQIVRAAETQTPIQLSPNLALHVTDRGAFQAGLANGNFEGVSLVPTKPFREEAAKHMAELEEIERQLDDLSKRPGDLYSPVMKAKQKELQERQIELARLIQKAGNIDIYSGVDLIGHPQQAAALAVAQGIFTSLGKGGTVRKLQTVAASMDQEQAETRMIVTGTAAVGLAIATAGTASPLLGLVNAASIGFASTLTDQVFTHEYLRFLYSQGIIKERPYFDKVQSENASILAAGRGALTFGFNKVGAPLGALTSRAAGALASSAFTSNSLDEFARNAITQFILSGASADALSKFGSSKGFTVLLEALALDAGAGVAADLARVAGNDGVYTFSNGTQIDVTKGWKNFAAAMGGVAISNAVSTGFAEGLNGRNGRSELQAVRAAYEMSVNPDVYNQIARVNPKLAEAAVRTFSSDAIDRINREHSSSYSVSHPQFLGALRIVEASRQSAETNVAVKKAEDTISRTAPKQEPSNSAGVLERLRQAWGRTADQLGAFLGKKSTPIDWDKIPEGSRKALIQQAIRQGHTDEGLTKLGISPDEVSDARRLAPIAETQRRVEEDIQKSGKISPETIDKVLEFYGKAKKEVQDQIRALIDPLLQKSDMSVGRIAELRAKFGIKPTVIVSGQEPTPARPQVPLVGTDGRPLRDTPPVVQTPPRILGSDGEPAPRTTRAPDTTPPPPAPRTARAPETTAPSPATQPSVSRRTDQASAPATPSPAAGPSPAFRAVSEIPGAARSNFDIPTLARLAEVPSSEVSGLARQALSQQPKAKLEQALQQPDISPSTKANVEEALSLQSARPTSPKNQKAELRQTSTALSNAISKVAQQEIARGVETGIPRDQLNNVANSFGLQNFLGVTAAQSAQRAFSEGMIQGTPIEKTASNLESRGFTPQEITEARKTVVKSEPTLPRATEPVKPVEVTASATPRSPPDETPRSSDDSKPKTKGSLVEKITSLFSSAGKTKPETASQREVSSESPARVSVDTTKPDPLLSQLQQKLFGKKKDQIIALPKAGPSADGSFLVQRKYGYSEDPSFTRPMAEAIDNAVAQINKKLASGESVTAADVFRIMDSIADVRREIAKSKNDPGKELFGKPLIRVGEQDNTRRGGIVMEDHLAPSGRHSEFFERATLTVGEMLSAMKAKKNWTLKLFGETYQRSTVLRLGEQVVVFHPKASDGAPLVQKAMAEWAKALSSKTITEAQFMDKMGEVYTALMHATPYMRGTPAIVESLLDASLRAKFGKTLGAKTDEAFWGVILAPSQKPVLKGADLVRIFGGKVPEAETVAQRSVASTPDAPRPPPENGSGRSLSTIASDLVSTLKNSLSLSSSSPVDLKKATALAPEGITPEQAAQIIQAQKKALQKAHEVPMDPTWVRDLMDKAVLGEGAVPRSRADASNEASNVSNASGMKAVIDGLSTGKGLTDNEHLAHFRNFFKMHFGEGSSNWESTGFKRPGKVGKSDEAAVIAGIRKLHADGELKYLGEFADRPDQGNFHWFKDRFGNLVRIRSSDNTVSTIYEASNRNTARVMEALQERLGKQNNADISQDRFAPLRLEMEAQMHREWAASRGFEPRYKTTDQPGKPGGKNLTPEQEAIRDKLVAAGEVIDIAAVRDPTQLPQAIRKANQDSAERAFAAVEKGLAEGADFSKVLETWKQVESGKLTLAKFLEAYPHIAEGAVQIHDAWRNNNSYLGEDHPQMRPFFEERSKDGAIRPGLTVSEQKKDVDIIIAAHKLATKAQETQREIAAHPAREKITESSDALHSVWQDYNSYLSRYKPMKNADGTPVTDIGRYIEERQIPPEHRRAYRQNTSGTFEEDIKILPNRFLAPNNAQENVAGAASALRALSDISRTTPKTSDEAAAQFEKAVQRAHSDWWDRNKDWVGPASIPRELRLADIDTQYNGAIQMYRLAEMQGLLSDPTIRRGVESYLDKLAEKKFVSYKGMDVSDAHLAMHHATGTKPAIFKDHHVEDFFDGKLKHYDTEMPTDRARETEAVLGFLRNNFPKIEGVPFSSLQIRAPPVPPGSSARVYLLQHKDSGETVAVMKIQKAASGLDEIVSTMAVERAITTDSSFAPVKTLAAGKLKGGDYFFIQEGARGVEADKAFKGTSQDRSEMAQAAARALATLHGRVTSLSPEQAKKVAGDLKALQGNGFYDARALQDYLEGGARDVLSLGMREKSLSPQQAKELQERLGAAVDAYSRILELSPERLGPALIHGDMHGGNLFIDSKRGKVTIIDYGGATYFIGRKMNTGDRGNDVGRFVGNMLVEGTRHGHDLQQDTLPLIRKFLSDYKEQAGISRGSQEEAAFDASVKVYLSRFVAVNAADTAGKKFKPIEGDSSSQLRSRLFTNWIETMRGLDAKTADDEFRLTVREKGNLGSAKETETRAKKAYQENLEKAVSEPHPDHFEFRNFNDGMKAALSWLSVQGFSGELRDFKVGKFDPKKDKGLPRSLTIKDENGNSIKIRIEVAPLRAKDSTGKDVVLFDGKPRAHINVAFNKEKGPHFLIPGGDAEVDAILKQLLPTFGPQTKPTSGTELTLPRTEAERRQVTAKAVSEHLPNAQPALVKSIQDIVENVGHFNQTGVVTHGTATPEQLRARTEDIRKALVAAGVNSDVAKKITTDVIRGGAAGEAATGSDSPKKFGKLRAPLFFKLLNGAGNPYVDSPSETSAIFRGEPNEKLELELPNGKRIPVREKGRGYSIVEVPFRDFEFGQSSFDTSASRLPGMIQDGKLLARMLQNGVGFDAVLRENGRVSIADMHHRILSMAVRDAFARVGGSTLKPGDKGFDAAASEWAKKYIVPLMNLAKLPNTDFQKTAERLLQRMDWLENLLGESTIPVRVPVWQGGVPLVRPETPSMFSGMYTLRKLIFQQDISGIRNPELMPRVDPSVEHNNHVVEILDRLDKAYPIAPGLSSKRALSGGSEISTDRSALPKTKEERFSVTEKSAKEVLGENLEASQISRIQEVVEDAHQRDSTETGKDGTTVYHGNYTNSQLKRKLREIPRRLQEELLIPKDQARELAKKVIQRGAAGNARENDFTDAYRNGDYDDVEKPPKTTHKNGAGGQTDLKRVKRIGQSEGLTEEQMHVLGERIHELKKSSESDGLKDHKGDLVEGAIRELARSIREKREFDPANVVTKDDRQKARAARKQEKLEKKKTAQSEDGDELDRGPDTDSSPQARKGSRLEQKPKATARFTGTESYVDFYDDLVVLRGPQMDGALRRAAENTPRFPGWLTIVAHGSSFEPRIRPTGVAEPQANSRSTPVSAGNLVEAIRDFSSTSGIRLDQYEGIVFVSCFGGSCQNDFIQAEKLANASRLPVVAADGLVRASSLAVKNSQNGVTDLPWRVYHPSSRGYRTPSAAQRGMARFVLQELNRRHQRESPVPEGIYPQGLREVVGQEKFEDFYHIVGRQDPDSRKPVKRPRGQRARKEDDVFEIQEGDVVSVRVRGANSDQILTGRYIRGTSASEEHVFRLLPTSTDGSTMLVHERDVLSLRKGKSIDLLHDFTPADTVILDSKTGRVVGYSPDGDYILFKEEGAKQITRIPSASVKSARLVKPGFALSESEMRALPDASEAASMAEDPKKPFSVEEKRRLRASGVTDFRPEEFPYQRPSEALLGDSASPIRIEQLKEGTVYLWVIRQDGVLVVIPEERSGKTQQTRQYNKHRDADPTPDGLRGRPGRLAGELRVTRNRDGKTVVHFDRESSYVYNRKDGVSLTPGRGDWLDPKMSELLGGYFKKVEGTVFQEVGGVQ